MAAKLEEVRFALDQDRLVAALEDVPDPPVPTVETLGEDAVQLPHAAGQVRRRRFDEQVVVVVHLAPGVTEPSEAFDDTRQNVDDEPAILVTADDIAARVAAAGHVIERAGVFDAERPRHGGIMMEVNSILGGLRSAAPEPIYYE